MNGPRTLTKEAEASPTFQRSVGANRTHAAAEPDGGSAAAAAEAEAQVTGSSDRTGKLPVAAATNTRNPTMLTVEQAAARWQVTARDIRSLIALGALAHCVIGGKVRLPVQDLDDYGRRVTIKPWAKREEAA